MFDNLKFDMGDKKVYMYSAGIGMCILSVFGVIILASAGTERLENALPSPSPAAFGDILGAQSQQNQPVSQQPMQHPLSDAGPMMPSIKPSPTPSPSLTPSPSPSLSPSPAPSVSPSVSPSPASSPNSNSDTSGPSISEVKASNIEKNKVNIDWKTNEDADEKVEYGKETSYGTNKENSEKRTSHSLEIVGLDANTTYHYRIVSKDNAGNTTTSGDNTFTTLP